MYETVKKNNLHLIIFHDCLSPEFIKKYQTDKNIDITLTIIFNNDFSGNFQIKASSLLDVASFISNKFTGNQFVSGNINITGSIIPSGSASFDLGSYSNPWQHIYVSTGSIKFVGANNREVARISINKTSGEISLLNTSTLSSASIAQIDAGTFTGSAALSAISASNLYVSGAIELGYSYTSTYEIQSSNINQNTIISIPTGSYTGAFYNYIITKGAAARAGQMMSVWNGANLSFTETPPSRGPRIKFAPYIFL